MTGKNNRKVQLKRTAARNPQYGIKKLSVGVVSIAVGTILSLGANPIQAEEISLIETVQVDQSLVEDNAIYAEEVIEEIPILETEVVVDDVLTITEINEVVDEEMVVVADVLPTIDSNETIEEVIPINDSAIIEDTSEEVEEGILDGTETVEDEAETGEDEIIEIATKIQTPEIIDIYTDYDHYVGDQPVKMTLIIKEESELELVNISYGNVSSYMYEYPYNSDITYMESSISFGENKSLVRNEEGNYVIEFILGEHMSIYSSNYAPGEFKLNLLSIYNSSGNIFRADGTLIESSFLYKNHENQNLIKAQHFEIPYETTYTYYEENVNPGVNGAVYYYEDGTSYTLQPINKVILYDYVDKVSDYWTEFNVNYDLPAGTEKVVRKGENGVLRYFYNQFGNEISYEIHKSTTSEVIEYGASYNALLEEQNASFKIKNNIKIIDKSSGYVITENELKGDSIFYRNHEFVEKLENRLGIELGINNTEIINRNLSSEIFNGEYIETRDINVYVSSESPFDIREGYQPLVPDWLINYGNKDWISGIVSLYEDNEKLLEYETDEYATVDSAIKKGLGLLDESKYFFDKVDILAANKLHRYDIKIYVRERLTKKISEANYDIIYTNNLSEVRTGVLGTKYIYSDGTEGIVEAPIREVRYTDIPLTEIETIDLITSDKSEYAVGEIAEIIIKGKTNSPIEYLELRLINEHPEDGPIYIFHHIDPKNIVYDIGEYVAKLYVKIYENYQAEKIVFQMAPIRSENGPGNYYNFANPLNFSFSVADKSLVGTEVVPFDTNYTTDESAVSEGQEGSKLVYSDGTEIILTTPVSAVQLYNSEVAEVDFDIEYTVYAHEVRSGIKGSKLVYENGEEVLLEKPTAAKTLYDNKIEEFDFVTVKMETSGLAYGETQVMQEGITGRRVVFYDADGEVVDRLVVSAPVNRIVQVGANKQTLFLTPYETTYTIDATKVQSGQNGAKYVYSNGSEEVISASVNAVNLYRYVDEVVGFDEIIRENSLLAKGQLNVISAGMNGLKRAFYDVKGELVESTLLLEAANRIVEVGTYVEVKEEEPEVPDEEPETPGEDENTDTEPVDPDETDNGENPDVDPEAPGEDENTDTDPIDPEETAPDETDNEENPTVDPEAPGEDENTDTTPVDPGETDPDETDDDEENPDAELETPGENEDTDTDPIDPEETDPDETDDEENPAVDPEAPGEDEDTETDPIGPEETDDEENLAVDPETPDLDSVEPGETNPDEIDDEKNPAADPESPSEGEDTETDSIDLGETDPDEKDDEETSDGKFETPLGAIAVESKTTIAAANLLPSTGEKYGTIWLTVAGVSLFAGIGLVFKGKRKKDTDI